MQQAPTHPVTGATAPAALSESLPSGVTRVEAPIPIEPVYPIESAVPHSAGALKEPAASVVTVERRKRPRPGERRVQILQVLAAMLEAPGAERVTTAGLAGRLGVSEAALYRHFASKAQMFEGLIEFIEQSVFTLTAKITAEEPTDAATARRQASNVVAVLLQFGERNPGMARVMVGDALVFENERLMQRMAQLFDRVESTLRQCLRPTVADHTTPTVDAQVQAGVLCAFVVGRLQRFTRSGFRRLPTDHMEASLDLLLNQ